MGDIIYKEESYQIIGKCMNVYNNLGGGFLEIVYKDALELEFRKVGIPYQREKEYCVIYEGVVLPHKFVADFVVMDKIILEVKANSGIADDNLAQTLNYLAVSKCKLGICVNFGRRKLEYKRVLL
jgi:GxxExxY protein